ncbi:MAG: hypothetical protein B7Z54_00335, partial [Sphingobacteriales bacterium 12-47-4]
DNIAAGQYLVIGYLISDEWKKYKPEVVANQPEVKELVKPAEPEMALEKPVVETPKTVVSEPVKVEPKPVQSVSQKSGSEGYFKPFYDQQIKLQPVSKQQTLNASIFKTLSGWQDGKFYLLMDNVLPGTIVKLSNPENGKVVYAKVLGEMAGIKLNQGLDIRISNAAASVLEIPEANTEKFIVQIEW